MQWGRGSSAVVLVLIGIGAIVVAGLAGSIGSGFAFAVGMLAGSAIVAGMATGQSAVRLAAATSDASRGWAEFHRELARARRFDRAFGIVRFAGAELVAPGETRIRDRLAAMSRRIDRVWADGDDVFVLLPEADAAAVDGSVVRARQRIGEGLGQPNVAIFPSNGITSGAMIACLYQGDSSPVAIGAHAPANPVLAIHLAALTGLDETGDVAGTAT